MSALVISLTGSLDVSKEKKKLNSGGFYIMEELKRQMRILALKFEHEIREIERIVEELRELIK